MRSSILSASHRMAAGFFRSSTIALTIACNVAPSSVAIVTPCRSLSFSAYLNLDDPEESLRHVREEIDQLKDTGLVNSTAHLQKLVNIALCHLQRGDLVMAQECAMYAHDKIIAERGSNCTILFFSSKTAARCCDALADAYEAHVKEMESLSHNSDALTPGPSKILAPSRFIEKLRQDAARFRSIADRIYNDPRNFWMRAGGREDGGPQRSQTHWDDSSSSSQHDARFAHGSARDPTAQDRRHRTQAQLRRQHISRRMGGAPGPK